MSTFTHNTKNWNRKAKAMGVAAYDVCDCAFIKSVVGVGTE